MADIKKIIYKDNKEILEVSEMKLVVEHYIKIRKNKTIIINIDERLLIFGQQLYLQEITKLTNAFVIASEWFKLNTYKK